MKIEWEDHKGWSVGKIDGERVCRASESSSGPWPVVLLWIRGTTAQLPYDTIEAAKADAQRIAYGTHYTRKPDGTERSHVTAPAEVAEALAWLDQ